MNIETYFNEIQEYIKKKSQNTNLDINVDINLDLNLEFVKDENIQAIINQEYNKKTSIEDCGEMILKIVDLSTKNNKVLDNPDNPDSSNVDQIVNTMERKILNFSDYINENNL